MTSPVFVGFKQNETLISPMKLPPVERSRTYNSLNYQTTQPATTCPQTEFIAGSALTSPRLSGISESRIFFDQMQKKRPLAKHPLFLD
jgi:hypothetical protein